jgi:hypothetical protein
MLYFDTSLELEGVTLFRDYNSPNRYYYMPRAPHLSVEAGQPMFQLLIYRRDITDNPDFKDGDRPGGGFLTMTVDIGVPQSVVENVRRQLASRVSGPVDLVPVPFEDGTVRVTALGVSSGNAADPAAAGTGAHFVENIIGTARPSLYGDNRAVFSIETTHEGALLLKASLEDNGATQVGVVYDLSYSGLMPAYEVSITINFRQSYQYLRSRFNLSTLVFKEDLDSEFEKLMKEGHIVIQEVDYLVADNDPAKRAERAQKLTELAKELATWSFFRPGLTPGKVLADDRGPPPPPAPTIGPSADGVTDPLRAAATGVGSAGDVAGPRVQATSANPNPARVAGQPNPPADSSPAATPAAGGNSAVDAWNRAGRPQASYIMKSLTQEEQQTITFDLRQVAAARRSAAPQGGIRLMAGAANLAGRIKEVDLNDPFFEKITVTVGTSADFDAAGVSSMVVKMRYGVRDDGSSPKETHEFPLTKSGDKSSYTFFMDRARNVAYEYQIVVTYKAGFALGNTDLQSTSPWITTTTRNLDVDPRVLGSVIPVSLVVGAVDWGSIKNLQTTVSYEDATNEVKDQRTVLTTATSPQTALVPIRPRDPSVRRYHVHSVYLYNNGIEEAVERDVDGDRLVVLNPPSARAVPVTMSAVDPLGRYRKITVELDYNPPGGEQQTKLIELPGDGASASFVFFRPDEKIALRYRYRVTLFGRDGSSPTSEWQETIERQLIVGDRFDGMLDVEVDLLLPDFASFGLLGVKLKLDYPDAAPGVKSSYERYDSSPPQPFHVRIPKRPGGGDKYTYTLQWFRTDRSVKVEGPFTSEDQSIQIFPPLGA